MYESHFGLTGRPFEETVNPERFVSLPSRQAVLRRLRYGLEHGQGPALLFGAIGTGKTILAQTLARSIGSRFVHMTFPAMPPAELVAYVADELAESLALESAPPLNVSVRRTQSLLATAASRGDRTLLIVDEAHLIEGSATFETLRLFLNFATAGTPDLLLLLVGAPEVLLRLPPALADRLAARCLLNPLTEPESTAYIEGRLAAAGASESLFSREALFALYRASDGLPRRLNRLADLALLIAFAEGRSRADAACIDIAAREAFLEPSAA